MAVQSGTTDLGATIGGGGGGGGGGVTSLNSLTGTINLIGGTGVVITPSGNNIVISSTDIAAAITSINGDTTTAQTLSVGTAGTDFAITNPGGGSHVFNLPTASATNRGALSSADFTTFNNKQPAGAYITGLTTDVVATGPGTVAATIQPNVVTNAKLAQMPTLTIKGNNTGGTANASDLTVAQVNAILPVFTSTLNGLVPLSGGGTTNFLRADGTFAAPPGATSGTVTSVALALPAGVFTITGSPVTTSGTLTGSFNTQTANTVFAGPTSGGAATPAFRALVAADIPTISGSQVSGGTFGAVNASNLTNLPAGSISGVVPIANGGTNNSAAYTAGSIIFSDGTKLTQDNANFFWNDTNQSIGIGTNTPAAAAFIDAVNISGATKRILLTGYGVGSLVGERTRFARGTAGSPTAAQSGDILGFYNAEGYGASQFPAAGTGAMTFYADENFTNTSNATRIGFNTTPTGAVTTTEVMRINSNGSIALGATSSTAIHQINGGINRTTRTISANLAVDTTTTDDIIYCNAAGPITVTLPVPTNGRVLTIKDISGNATTNNITIARHAAETIEGIAASHLIQVSYGTIIISSDGTNWWIVG